MSISITLILSYYL